MNAVEQARMAYASPEAPVRTPRGMEAEALVRVTRALSDAAAGGHASFPRLAAALHDNRRLWTLLASSVADSENALPEMLRARIFYLAEFTAKHSAAVLRGAADVGPLVDLNRIVLKGLRDGDASVAAGDTP